MDSSFKSIQPPHALSGIYSTPSPPSSLWSPGHSKTLSHARHAALDEREIEKTISAYPEPPHIDHLDTFASDLVECSLATRPRCVPLRELEKRRTASNDIRMEIHDTNQMPTIPSSRLTSLSVYASSTTTFAWPRLLPASQMHRGPVLYADFGCMGSQLQRYEYSEQCFPRQAPPSPVTTKQPDCTLSLNVEPSKSLSVYPRCWSDMGSSGRGDRRSLSLMDYRVQSRDVLSYPAGRISSDTDGEDETRPTPSPRVQQWERYAEEIRTTNGRTAYLCLWTITQGDRVVSCNYLSKKQLVKRHIETTHLKFKPFVCDLCQKAFPQKTSLDIHISGHTGDTPHECKFHCGEAFKDPARRHRHHVEVHGYIPKQSKKKHKVDTPEY